MYCVMFGAHNFHFLLAADTNSSLGEISGLFYFFCLFVFSFVLFLFYIVNTEYILFDSSILALK